MYFLCLSQILTIKDLLNMMGVGEFLPSNLFMDCIASMFCHSGSSALCSNVLFIIAGFDEAQVCLFGIFWQFEAPHFLTRWTRPCSTPLCTTRLRELLHTPYCSMHNLKQQACLGDFFELVKTWVFRRIPWLWLGEWQAQFPAPQWPYPRLWPWSCQNSSCSLLGR